MTSYLKYLLLRKETGDQLVVMMWIYVLPLAAAIFFTNRPAIAQKRADGAEVVVSEGAPLSVECALRVDSRADWRVQRGGAHAEWAAPAPDLRAAGERALPDGRLLVRLQAPRAAPAHQGLYRCHPAAAPVRVRLLPPERHANEAAEQDDDDPALDLRYYKLYEPLELNCTFLRGVVSYTWTKNRSALAPGRGELQEDGAVLAFKSALEEDWGTYRCAAGGETFRAWLVHAYNIARLPADSNVVEGQKLTLTCKVLGRPAQRVRWASSPDNVTWTAIDTEAQGARWSARDSAAGVPGGVLELAAAARADAGLYTCAPTKGASATTTLRVKGMYAALWPFLGICVEVAVLCAVILCCERRRARQDADDSQADTHDQ